jgi:hypothetical protein
MPAFAAFALGRASSTQAQRAFDELADRYRATVAYRWRKIYNLPPSDPRFTEVGEAEMLIDYRAHQRDEEDRVKAIRDARAAAAGGGVTEAETEAGVFAAVLAGAEDGTMDHEQMQEIIAAMQQQAAVEPDPEDDPDVWFRRLGILDDSPLG